MYDEDFRFGTTNCGRQKSQFLVGLYVHSKESAVLVDLAKKLDFPQTLEARRSSRVPQVSSHGLREALSVRTTSSSTQQAFTLRPTIWAECGNSLWPILRVPLLIEPRSRKDNERSSRDSRHLVFRSGRLGDLVACTCTVLVGALLVS